LRPQLPFFPLQRSFSTPISALFYPSLSISFPNPFPPIPPRLFHRSWLLLLEGYRVLNHTDRKSVV
jgi:hypothetical protein